MSLCHLYNITTSSQHIQKIMNSFDDASSLDIDKIDSLKNHDIYIIELENADNNISKKIINLFKEKKLSLIYFLVSQNHNLILFQLTYKLNTKDIITKGQDTDKVIQNIQNDLNSIKPDISTCRDNNTILSRLDLLDLLQERLESTNNNISAITVSFQNMQELQKDLTVLELEKYTNKTLKFMYELFEDNINFIQLDKDFYLILFNDLEFEDSKNLADDFQNAVLDNETHDKYKFFIDIFALDLNSLGLSEIMSTLNSIKLRNLSHKQTASDYIEHTSKAQNIISEEDVLNDAFREKTEIKLLNIYNGLVITTPSKIIKQTDENIYVTFEQLQGVVMNIEKETILQSNTFLQDILATIKVINLKKKIAVLEDFRFLSTNANSRKYARVTTSTNMPIVIHIDNLSINGHVIDLSIKSIAIKTKFTKQVLNIKGRDVKLTFNIPNYRFDNGYVQLHVDAKVVVILNNKDDNCKVVFDLVEGTEGESIIREYVYDRQKELIIEVKKMSKLA